jgi:hypothetical protein
LHGKLQNVIAGGFAALGDVDYLPLPTEPSRPRGKRCNPKTRGRIKRLELRPPAAVNSGTPLKGRGRTGSALRGSFALFQMDLERTVNDQQTKQR